MMLTVLPLQNKIIYLYRNHKVKQDTCISICDSTNKLCPTSGPSGLQLFRMLAAPLNSFLTICVTTQDNGCLVASGFFT